MKKIMIIAIMLGIAIFSLVYSGVLNYYGRIVGNITVQGPIFYADLQSSNSSQGKLLLNSKPENTYTTTFYDNQTIIFESDELNTNFNYKPKCIFSVKINSSQSGEIRLTCSYVDTNNTTQPICSISLSFTSPGVYTATCTSELTQLTNVKKLQLQISRSKAEDFTIETNTNGDTYLQITKAES